jgi:phage shock protein PspC (stress-responsive transcriptional regulator)
MSEHTTHIPEIKRLERVNEGRILTGVSAGLGRYFDLNPNVFRLGLVVLTLVGGAGILVYLAALLVMPAEGADKSIAEQVLTDRRDHPWALVGFALAGIAILVLLTHASSWPTLGAGWILVLLAGLVILAVARSDRATRRIAWLFGTLAALILVAIIAAAITAFAWFNVSLSNGTGDRNYTPASAADVHSTYKLGVGRLGLDLSQVRFTSPQDVHVKVGIGHVHVFVPRDTKVLVNAHAKVGDVNVFGETDDGQNASIRAGAANGNVLHLDVRVGGGDINVERAR